MRRLPHLIRPTGTYPAYGRTCRADKAFKPHPPVARCRCRMRRLPRLIRPTGTYPAYGDVHVGRIRRSRRIRQWRGADAGCDACRVLSGLRGLIRPTGVHVGRIRRSSRIRQWRGADAGCDACRVLSGLRGRTCRADKAFTPHPPAVVNYCLRKKSLYNIYKCAALQEKFGAPCCAPVSGL